MRKEWELESNTHKNLSKIDMPSELGFRTSNLVIVEASGSRSPPTDVCTHVLGHTGQSPLRKGGVSLGRGGDVSPGRQHP
jgi:hypothetical protein